MLKIEELYGIETIVHIEKPTEQQVKGLYTPIRIPNWLEATVIVIGKECRKDLKPGDTVIIDKHTYEESPILTSEQFNFDALNQLNLSKGTFHIMTEHMLVMKVVKKPIEQDIEQDTE